MPTRWASSTATSSRPTCCWTSAASCGSPTSAWPACRARAGLTVTGDLLGTLRYMSPGAGAGPAGGGRSPHRRLLARRHSVRAADACEPAFAGADRQEVLRQIAFEEPRPPRRLNAAIPRELETIVLKAWRRTRADRYATAQELADDLRRFLDDKPIRARPPTLANRAVKWTRRHQGTVASGVLITLILVASLGWIGGDRQGRRAGCRGSHRRGFADRRAFAARGRSQRFGLDHGSPQGRGPAWNRLDRDRVTPARATIAGRSRYAREPGRHPPEPGRSQG